MIGEMGGTQSTHGIDEDAIVILAGKSVDRNLIVNGT
jgi:hypothetical protein